MSDLKQTALLAGFDPKLNEHTLVELSLILLADEKFKRDVDTFAAYDDRLGAPGSVATGDEILYAVLAAYSHGELCALRNRIFNKRHWEVVEEENEERQRRSRIRARLLNRKP